MTVVVEPAAAADADHIRRLDGLTPATGRLVGDELAASHHCAVVARADGAVVGYAAAACHLDEAQIVDVVVATAWRRQGIGTRLVTELLRRTDRRGATSATLEVRAGNAEAQALYRHLGFTVEGRRPRYYPDGEAALIMWRRADGRTPRST